ncbi:hypothetical protein PQU94_08205 [Asticcacaulis sp. DXS10W]|uniref:Uncharacterized protein n=1 Tax=Asticcacaulis currens TaxID=2984210 RepID=A0ABT5IDH6_9CAUL|nr:hypothetical protein [Asticcacaulis currens]MDC7694261.1 hypothetical protein [Asticcacaulis currens]
METSIKVARAAQIGFAVGLFGLGLTSLIAGTFAMQWQPTPPWVPIQVSYLSNALLILAGVGLLFSKTKRWAAILTPAMFAVWLLALKVPETVALFGKINEFVSWVGFLTPFSEEVAMLGGALVLYGLIQDRSDLTRWNSTWGIGRILFGLACVQFGASHYGFADFTAGMIPHWIPARLPLAYITGTGHLCAGLAILAGPFLPKVWRLAAGLEATMMWIFVILVHIPMILANNPKMIQLSWTLIFIATLLASSALAITAQACRKVEEDKAAI